MTTAALFSQWALVTASPDWAARSRRGLQSAALLPVGRQRRGGDRLRLSVTARIEPETSTEEVDSWAGGRPGMKCATLKAEQRAAVELMEGRRPLKAYMSLPASQYSVLDAELVERLGDNIFVCTLTTLRIFGSTLRPVLTAQVDVAPDGSGCVIKVIDAKITGTKAIEDYTANFRITSTNRVSWRPMPNGRAEIWSDTTTCVDVAVPAWFPFSVAAVASTGNFVLRQVHAQVVPRFVAQLAEDYARWGAGSDAREAVANGELFATSTQQPAQK